jgi:hypothetical protein
MNIPYLVVEIAFDDGPLDASPTWTNITNKVRAGSIRQGRSNELEQNSAGVLNLTLDNRGRTFDPFYASGPYYGKLTTRRQIRVRAFWSSMFIEIFRGHITGWPLSPELGTDMVCQIEAFDFLAYLSTIELPVDRFSAQIEKMIDEDVYWFALGASGQNCPDKWRYGTKITGTDYTFTTTTPVTGDAPSQWMSGSSNTFNATYGAIGPVVRPADETVISFLVRTTTAGSTGKINPIIANAVSAPNGWVIGVNDAGRLCMGQNSSSGVSYVATSLPINDGNWHHVELRIADHYPSSSYVYCLFYVDGYDLGAGSLLTWGGTWSGMQLIGMSADTTMCDAYFTGDLAHVIVAPVTAWDTAQESVATSLFRYGTYYGEPYSSIAQEIIDYAGLTDFYTDYLINEVVPAPGGQKWNKSALSALQEIATSLNGRFHVNGDGTIYLRSQAADFNDGDETSWATFSDDGTSGVVKYHDIGSIVLSDEFLYNQVTITTADGVAVTANNTTSQTNYGVRSYQRDTSLRNLNDAASLAANILNQYAEPVARFKEWKTGTNENTVDAAIDSLLELYLGNRVTVEIVPNNVGSRLSQQLYIEQISHDFTPQDWFVTYSGRPTQRMWTLENATYGLLETTTILG